MGAAGECVPGRHSAFGLTRTHVGRNNTRGVGSAQQQGGRREEGALTPLPFHSFGDAAHQYTAALAAGTVSNSSEPSPHPALVAQAVPRNGGVVAVSLRQECHVRDLRRRVGGVYRAPRVRAPAPRTCCVPVALRKSPLPYATGMYAQLGLPGAAYAQSSSVASTRPSSSTSTPRRSAEVEQDRLWGLWLQTERGAASERGGTAHAAPWAYLVLHALPPTPSAAARGRGQCGPLWPHQRPRTTRGCRSPHLDGLCIGKEAVVGVPLPGSGSPRSC